MRLNDKASAAELTAANPFVPNGEIFVERDTGKAKRGPGFWNDLTTHWNPAAGTGVTFDDVTAAGDLTVTGNASANALTTTAALVVGTLLQVGGDLDHNGTNVGFYGATPVAQAAAIVDASGGTVTDVEARAALNDLLAAIRALGLIAA